MSPQFQPIREDGRSRAQVCFDYLQNELAHGTVTLNSIVRHEDLASEMEVDYPSSAYYQAIGKATEMLQRVSSRSLIPEKGVGYRVIAGMKMVDQGRGYYAQAGKRNRKALAVVQAVDEGTLETGDRSVLRQVQKGFSIVAAVLSQQAEQIAQLSEDTEALKQARLDDRATTAADIAEIRDRLIRLESAP